MIRIRVLFFSFLGGILLSSCGTEFAFVQITDPQFGFISENRGISEESLLYGRAVEKINELKPTVVIITGDLVHDRDNKDQWNEFRRLTAILDSKNVYVLPGNHDIGQEPGREDIREFQEMFGYDRFSFVYRKCRFIGINSNLIKAGSRSLEEEQFQWLRSELAKSSAEKHVFLFCHHPFFIKDPGEPEEYFNIKPDVRKKYLDLFAEHGVDAIFAGHLHKNASAESGAVKMVTTSSSGKQLGKDKPGFRLVKVSGEGFRHEYIITQD